MEKVIDARGGENYIDISLVIGFTQMCDQKDGLLSLIDEYQIISNSAIGYFLTIKKKEVLRLKEIIEGKQTELEEVKSNLTTLRDIDDLLRSIRSTDQSPKRP